jgi:hypothetical protein
MKYTCPVCGYPNLEKQPRGEMTGGSYEICPSCSFQFGVTDEDKGFTYVLWRKDWIKRGMPWQSAGGEAQPNDWDPIQQLKNIDSD